MSVCILLCKVRCEPRKDRLNERIKKMGGYESDNRSYETQSTDTPVRNKIEQFLL